jgi:protein SCO1/2
MVCRRVVAFLVCILGLPTLTACEVSATRSQASPARTILEQPGSWMDETGNPATLSSLAGEPFLVTAVFTSCTTRCPLTIEKVRAVDEAFRSRGAPVAIRLLTLDPITDTPERLRHFKEERHLPDSWHFLRGSLEDTHALARYLRVHAAYDDAHIDHDVQIAVFDKRGRLAKSFSSWSFDVNAAVVTQ